MLQQKDQKMNQVLAYLKSNMHFVKCGALIAQCFVLKWRCIHNGNIWHVYYYKICVPGVIRLLRDSVNAYSVLVEKVTPQLCHYHGKCVK